MKKIKTLFQFNRARDVITNVVNTENQWVLDGEGSATIKIDGTSCAVINGKLYKRFDRKLNKKSQQTFFSKQREGKAFIPNENSFRELPEGSIACNETYDPVTFHWPHWAPVLEQDKHHIEAFNATNDAVQDGTYELIGPKVGENLYNLESHQLVRHGNTEVEISRTFEAIRSHVINTNHEGLVFIHPDGRMCKIRRSDFAIDRSREFRWKGVGTEAFQPLERHFISPLEP